MSGYGTGRSGGGEAPDHWSPATDVMMRESGDLVIVMEIPDAWREDVEVSLTGGDLTLEITIQGYADTLEAESQRLEVLGPRD